MSTNLTSALSIPDIRDIKPPVPFADYWWMLWAGIVGLLLLTLFLLWWFVWRKRGLQAPVIPVIPAHVRAKRKLEEALALITQPKPFCILVSDTLRGYLEERFTFRAPERTTEEFLRELQDTDLLVEEQKESLVEFLEQCDLVKFAKYEPGEAELKNLHHSAVRLVEETESTEKENGVQKPPVPA